MSNKEQDLCREQLENIVSYSKAMTRAWEEIALSKETMALFDRTIEDEQKLIKDNKYKVPKKGSEIELLVASYYLALQGYLNSPLML